MKGEWCQLNDEQIDKHPNYSRCPKCNRRLKTYTRPCNMWEPECLHTFRPKHKVRRFQKKFTHKDN